MSNPFIFQSQQNIIFYQQEIAKLIDEIIEIDSKILQQQFNQQQMYNQFFMNPMMMMMMQNMQFMQNQFVNPQQILEQKIQLYKERLGKLNEEKTEKNNKLFLLNNQMNYNNMNQMFSQFCNIMNPFNNIQMNPMMNNMNKMNMMCGMPQMNPLPRTSSDFNKNVQNLIIRVNMENERHIVVQCQSSDKMEKAINNFLAKVMPEHECEFFIITEKLAMKDLTIKENGLDAENCYILVKKKKKELSFNAIKQNIDEEDKYKNNNQLNNNHSMMQNSLQNQMPSMPMSNFSESAIFPGNDIMNLFFTTTTNLKVKLIMNGQATFKDLLIKLCNRLHINESYVFVEKKIALIYNGVKLNVEDNRTLREVFKNNNPYIIVIDTQNLIGA